MSLDTRRTDDGTLVIRPPNLIGRCAECDVGIRVGGELVRGKGLFCSEACWGKQARSGELAWWKARATDEDDHRPWRITVDYAWSTP